MASIIPLLIGLIIFFLLCLGAIFDDRRARARRVAQRQEPARQLPLLHSINDDRCIGCEACVDVCPTEVLDLHHHKVRVARFSDCVQCEQCANACPTQALVMFRQGSTPRTLTVPEIDEQFQTGVPGQYLIGEIAGKPLVKNAANLGRAVVEHIANQLASAAPRDAAVLDVVIVGSGPGGLSAGLTCRKRGLTCVVLEKEHVLASTVSRYPKGKHFMAEPATAQNVSYLPVFDGAKEDLVAAWREVVDGAQLPVRLGEAVETVKRGDDGVLTVKSTVASYRARAVVLATGLRGKPRLLAVPGANLEKVQSLLDDPGEFAGQAVLVVGGGDSAVEGAMALTDAGATVTLSYRGDGFKRCKQGNQKRLAEMTEQKKLSVLLESNVKCFEPDSVTIKLADGSSTTIANQRTFVLIGADTPVAWLEANQVKFVERPHLYSLGSTEDAVRRTVPDAAACPRTPGEALAILLDGEAPAVAAATSTTTTPALSGATTSVATTMPAAPVAAAQAIAAPAVRAPTLTTPALSAAPTPVATTPAAPTATVPGVRAPTATAPVVAAPAVRAHAATTSMRSTATVHAATATPDTPTMPAQARPAAAQRDRSTAELLVSTTPHGDRSTAELPTLRVNERAARIARRERSGSVRVRLATQPPVEAATVEMSSLSALERDAVQRAKERCTDAGATLEIHSLPELERAALERITQLTAERDLPSDAWDAEWTGGDPEDAPTDIEMPSLRTLERATAAAAVPPPLPASRAISKRRALTGSVITSAVRPAASPPTRPAPPTRSATLLPPASPPTRAPAPPPARPRAVPPPLPRKIANGSAPIATCPSAPPARRAPAPLVEPERTAARDDARGVP